MNEVPAGVVAVVTGASRGLGAGLARRLGERGLRLGLCARSIPAVPDRPGASGVVTAGVDVTDAAEVASFARAVADQLGPIGLWVNNAGVLDPVGPLAEADPAEVARLLAVNVLGVVHGTQAYARHVRSRPGGGVLLNVTSGAASTPYSGWAPYCASKAAVDQLTRVVALEEASHGLRALSVSPGLVDTDMQARIRSAEPDRFPAVERFRRASADGTFNSPAWVADAMLDLAFGTGSGAGTAGDVVARIPEEPGSDTRRSWQ